jgi:hypothetical protein
MAWVGNRSTQGAFAPCFISKRIQNSLSLNIAKQQKILYSQCLNLEGEYNPTQFLEGKEGFDANHQQHDGGRNSKRSAPDYSYIYEYLEQLYLESIALLSSQNRSYLISYRLLCL